MEGGHLIVIVPRAHSRDETRLHIALYSNCSIMKKTLLSLSMAAMAFGAFAEDHDLSVDYDRNPPVTSIEVEWQAVGAATLFTDGDAGYDGNLQIRENLQGTPWSYGVIIGLYTPSLYKDYSYKYMNADGTVSTVWETSTQWVGGFYTGVLGEYDLRRGRGLNPYVNASAGFLWGGPRTVRPFIRPSFGVEIFTHLRMGVAAMITSHSGCAACFNISIVFGGGRKK